MDPRIAARRARVKQATQRASLKNLVRVLAVASIAAIAVWYLYSPFVDIDSIAVGGVDQADVEAALADLGVEVGDPLLLAPVGRLEERLAADPWVASASVDRIVPGILEVSVVERVPVLAVDSAGRHSRIALDGMVLDKPLSRPDDVPVFLEAVTQPAAGQVVEAGPIRDTLVFLEEFGPLSPLARFEMLDGELWLRLPDHDVRLGRTVDMAAKAASLRAVLADQPETGTVIVLIAPDRPTVQDPPAVPSEDSSIDSDNDAAGDSGDDSGGESG